MLLRFIHNYPSFVGITSSNTLLSLLLKVVLFLEFSSGKFHIQLWSLRTRNLIIQQIIQKQRISSARISSSLCIVHELSFFVFQNCTKPICSFDKFVNVFWIFCWFYQITRKRDWMTYWNWTFYRHCLYVMLILVTSIDACRCNWTKDGVHIFGVSFEKLAILFPFFSCNRCLRSSPRDSFFSFIILSIFCEQFQFSFFILANSKFHFSVIAKWKYENRVQESYHNEDFL